MEFLAGDYHTRQLSPESRRERPRAKLRTNRCRVQVRRSVRRWSRANFSAAKIGPSGQDCRKRPLNTLKHAKSQRYIAFAVNLGVIWRVWRIPENSASASCVAAIRQ